MSDSSACPTCSLFIVKLTAIGDFNVSSGSRVGMVTALERDAVNCIYHFIAKHFFF